MPRAHWKPRHSSKLKAERSYGSRPIEGASRKYLGTLKGSSYSPVLTQRQPRSHPRKARLRLYGQQQFEFLLIEEVMDISLLRAREQHWIDQLGSYTRGFNSKSQEDGPEPSLATHIEGAKRVYLPSIYAQLAPEHQNFMPNDLDRQGFRSDLRSKLWRKLTQIAITAALLFIGLELPFLSFVWIAIPFYFVPVILFDWPETTRSRANRRYLRAEAIARETAEADLIQFIAGRLGIPRERVAEAYPEAGKTVARRKERSDRYRRLNAELKRLTS